MPTPTEIQEAKAEAKLYNGLIDPKNILAKQKEAEKQQEALSTEQYEHLRWKAKTSLFYLSNSVLGYDRMVPGLHGHMCKWITNTQYDMYRMFLLPRGHYKSTVFTISDSIRIALPDVSGEMDAPYNYGTNVRILIGHETSGPPGGASRFLREITGHFCGNAKLMALFPECVPSKKINVMNQRELELPRTEAWGEPTFDTLGVGVRAQGRHYDFIKLDDLYGIEARDSRPIRQKTISWFNGIHSYMVSKRYGHIDLIGTRYSLDDIYNHAEEVYGDTLVRYIRRVEENINGKLQLIFPEENTYESLMPLRNDPVEWVQHTNDPIGGLTEFEEGWKRTFEWLGVHRIAVFSGSSQKVVQLHDCDRVILVDPARQGGLTGIIITAMDPLGRVFILESIKERLTDSAFCNLIFRLVQKWSPRTVGIEAVLFSELYQPWLEAEMRNRGVRFHITPMKQKRIGKTSEHKHDHIKALAPYYSAGLIFHHSSQNNYITEYDSFGATDDVHMLDALAYGPQMWTPGVSQSTWDSYREAEELLMEDRDFSTGYSRMY